MIRPLTTVSSRSDGVYTAGISACNYNDKEDLFGGGGSVVDVDGGHDPDPPLAGCTSPGQSEHTYSAAGGDLASYTVATLAGRFPCGAGATWHYAGPGPAGNKICECAFEVQISAEDNLDRPTDTRVRHNEDNPNDNETATILPDGYPHDATVKVFHPDSANINSGNWGDLNHPLSTDTVDDWTASMPAGSIAPFIPRADFSSGCYFIEVRHGEETGQDISSDQDCADAYGSVDWEFTTSSGGYPELRNAVRVNPSSESETAEYCQAGQTTSTRFQLTTWPGAVGEAPLYRSGARKFSGSEFRAVRVIDFGGSDSVVVKYLGNVITLTPQDDEKLNAPAGGWTDRVTWYGVDSLGEYYGSPIVEVDHYCPTTNPPTINAAQGYRFTTQMVFDGILGQTVNDDLEAPVEDHDINGVTHYVVRIEDLSGSADVLVVELEGTRYWSRWRITQTGTDTWTADIGLEGLFAAEATITRSSQGLNFDFTSGWVWTDLGNVTIPSTELTLPEYP